ncbi:glycosyltransferase family 4 protein [Maridesulfovibrio salexigens]|uniref:Glycosyl transferase group 1 n=1 Tax=Maridesulfovibrio salexigens (strain ATCC 14822 / DSM 2638 / NCIMB 8403 / VKM B-1763) TaxID=526222 RepID=C6BSR0_MARSD|nr:glycosyltransferase family 4 protein [Maridesulfovibrio salexigens]ACS81516.1 glycosyl transferase group 1 [Maridesulfovibrio salexigens DSM 2638]
MSRKILILVENLPSPFDRRVWQEATSLRSAGYHVSIICPTGKGYEKYYEEIEGVHIYRYDLPLEGEGAKGYAVEYSAALWHTFRLAWKVRREQGFDVIHACNPPDLLFLVGLVFKLLYKTKFIFDHHDINPELYEAKFNRRDFFWKLMVWLERATFMAADISIATNESYKCIAIERGKMDPEKVYVVRSGPKLDRLKFLPPVDSLKKGRTYLVGYVGVMGKQEGLDLLLQAVQYIVHDLGRHDIHFGLVGGGTSLEEMKVLAEELRVSDYVTFTGRVPDQELLEMLNTADICVNPDRANEMNDKSTMNKIMEYMALGKPIVQFDLTEGRFSAQGASLYAAPNDYKDMGDKILQLLDSPDIREKMGALGYRRVRNELEWKYEEPKLLQAYDAVFD